MARARKALCFRLGSREACRTDWGPLAHRAAAGQGPSAFGVDEVDGAFGSTELTLDMRVVDIETGADVSEVLEQRKWAEPLSRCGRKQQKPRRTTRATASSTRSRSLTKKKCSRWLRRVFDDSVDVFVPVESTVTHNGGPHEPLWPSLQHDSRFRRFAPRVASHIAAVSNEVPNLSPRRRQPYNANGKQRDAVAEALERAGAAA